MTPKQKKDQRRYIRYFFKDVVEEMQRRGFKIKEDNPRYICIDLDTEELMYIPKRIYKHIMVFYQNRHTGELTYTYHEKTPNYYKTKVYYFFLHFEMRNKRKILAADYEASF